ncbi:MAG: 50S ribosomal protein L9 [Methylococcaceae bacterium]|nr:50S ribosomal protein L9 [Methylococcaceae bacterium]
MEVILLEKVANLGDLGDKVSIKAGYGRNYLLPRGKAASATPEKIAEFEARRSELEKAAAEKLMAAQSRAATLEKLTIVIPHKAGEEGKLFGSVGTQNIADEINKEGGEVEKHEVRLPEGVIRHIGEFNVDISLHSDVTVTMAINVTAED